MFQTLKYVHEIYKERSFSRAAKNLYISQPSLSATIKKLEREIGTPIFDRSCTPIQLTDAGEVYLQTTQKILELYGNLEAYLQDRDEMKTGTLKLGASQFLASYLLPSLISSFNSHYPGIQIQVNETSSLEVQEKLLDSEVDLVIDSFEFDSSLFASTHLKDEYVLLAVPSSYAVNDKLKEYRITAHEVCSDAPSRQHYPTVSPTVFHEHTFLLLHKGHHLNSFAMGLFDKYQFSPDRIMYLDQLITSYNLVRHQIGVAFVSDTVIKKAGGESDVFLYRVDAPNDHRYINIAHKKNRYISKAMREFIRLSTLEFSNE